MVGNKKSYKLGCLHKIEKWCNENGFKFSQTKTVCLHFHKKRGILPEPELILRGNECLLVDKWPKEKK